MQYWKRNGVSWVGLDEVVVIRALGVRERYG